MTDVERVSREIHILKLIRHPHLIQLYEVKLRRRSIGYPPLNKYFYFPQAFAHFSMILLPFVPQFTEEFIHCCKYRSLRLRNKFS